MKNLFITLTLIVLFSGHFILFAQESEAVQTKQRAQLKQQNKETIKQKNNEGTAVQEQDQVKSQSQTRSKEQVKQKNSGEISGEQKEAYKIQSKSQTKEQIKDGVQIRLKTKTQTKEQIKVHSGEGETFQYKSQEKTATQIKNQQRTGFVDEDGDGINDHTNDPTKNGLKNGQDKNSEPSQKAVESRQMHKYGETNSDNTHQGGLESKRTNGEGMGTANDGSKTKQSNKNGKK